MKKIGYGALLLLLVSGFYLFREWNHIALKPTAEPWQPPPAAASSAAPVPGQPCANSEPLRQAFFGDLHVHTKWSFDARSRDMLGTADDAYRFSRGQTIGLGPFDANGTGIRKAQLKRPLDFAAVTDHAEWIGEVSVCTTVGSPVYDSPSCQAFRGEAQSQSGIARVIGGGSRMINLVSAIGRNSDICGPDDRWCRDALKNAWKQSQAATEAHYDRSADCTFTSFHGYEYSNSLGMSKVHRNVIFRNEQVPELPVSSLEQPDPAGLWETLDRLCNDATGDCEAISIPHNPNVSNGRMFRIPWRNEARPEQERQAALRARWEPVVEMMQIKGESECRAGLWQVFGEDEFCSFEKMRGPATALLEDCKDDYGRGALRGGGCISRLDFARYALIEGLREEERIGTNPYRFGFAGSTDTHNASPGDVAEDSYDGCCANTDTDIKKRLDPKPGFAGQPPSWRNPGGLMGIWAQENRRNSLFDAMQRREVFATSGVRIKPRFFAGEELDENACDDLAESGYRQGVPMGGSLSAGTTPTFVAAASADPEGGLLQRLQVIKVWHGGDGRFEQRVYDIAGGPNDASVNLQDCSVTGAGATQFCASWQDPHFDVDTPAAYYVRVLENPSCRWHWRQCLQLPADERPAACTDPGLQQVIQERAWTSPIWVSPAALDPNQRGFE